jgi:hypothetical protein
VLSRHASCFLVFHKRPLRQVLQTTSIQFHHRLPLPLPTEVPLTDLASKIPQTQILTFSLKKNDNLSNKVQINFQPNLVSPNRKFKGPELQRKQPRTDLSKTYLPKEKRPRSSKLWTTSCRGNLWKCLATGLWLQRTIGTNNVQPTPKITKECIRISKFIRDNPP